MTRNEILAAYAVEPNHLYIASPGKFEGEAIYVPYFHENAEDGEVLEYMEDGMGCFLSLIEITDDDRKEFPELVGPAKYIVIEENDQGFVNGRLLYSENEADYLRKAYEDDERC